MLYGWQVYLCKAINRFSGMKIAFTVVIIVSLLMQRSAVHSFSINDAGCYCVGLSFMMGDPHTIRWRKYCSLWPDNNQDTRHNLAHLHTYCYVQRLYKLSIHNWNNEYNKSGCILNLLETMGGKYIATSFSALVYLISIYVYS